MAVGPDFRGLAAAPDTGFSKKKKKRIPSHIMSCLVRLTPLLAPFIEGAVLDVYPTNLKLRTMHNSYFILM